MLWRTLSYVPTHYKMQYTTPENLKKFQEKRLKYIVDFAYRNTQLYHEKFKKAGITPSEIETVDDLTKIPLTTKGDIKAVYPHGSVAPGFSEETCIVDTTSGSSGSLLKVLYDLKAADRLRAVSFRNLHAQGVRPWHKFCILCRDPVELEGYSKTPFRVVGILEGRPEEELAATLEPQNPHVLGGHPSALAALAKVVDEKGIRISPRIILLGGELSLPWHRDYIEKVLKGETFIKYGAFEMNSIAWECSCHKMHIDADAVLLEFLKEGEPVSPGERGEIVATNLWNEAMPFIRYRLGDIGVPSGEMCECGRSLPLMRDLEGRADDFITLPSGELVPPTRVIAIFFTTPHIEQFQLVQTSTTHIKIEIIPRKEFTGDIEKVLLQRIRNALNESVDIEVEKVDNIKKTGSSKFRTIISKVAVDLASSKAK